MRYSRRGFLEATALSGMGAVAVSLGKELKLTAANSAPAAAPFMGNRFLTFNTVVRVNQIEVSRNKNVGADESHIHTPERVRAMRKAFERGAPGGKMTWAFSWLALSDPRDNYRAIRDLVVEYAHHYGDEITFIPGAYFSPMYNSREQVDQDIHEALLKIEKMVGNHYRPSSVVAGFLAAENLRRLSDKEKIHVAQGNIWSQFGIDNGDGDGAPSYPYYPSAEHFLKPAQSKQDFVDCVNLDGWTCDFLAARRLGFKDGFNSRMGVGPIETIGAYGMETGLKEMMATTSVHFDAGFGYNGFGWITNCWEVSLDMIPIEGLTLWLQSVKKRWPETQCVTQSEFGLAWRKHFRDNSKWNYRFVERGSGIGGSDADLEIRWFMNRLFRLALLRNWKKNEPELVIDLTRYDLPAKEPDDATPDHPTRNWSLINRINQKQSRPVDRPISITELSSEEKALIAKQYDDLIK